jgi:hypothetical protein
VTGGQPPAEVTAPGESPLVMSAEAPAEAPEAPVSPAAAEPLPEVAVAPRSGSPILDVLDSVGWKKAD